jgi:hypothetical protein
MYYMGEDKVDNVKAIIEATTGLVQAIPIYEDAIQPAAKQIGKSLEIVAKSITVVLAPISVLIWGYDKIELFIKDRLTAKLANVSLDNIIPPDPAIVGPSLEALRFVGNNMELRELYANLIASTMDLESARDSHPGFVEIIKNLSSEEARILKIFDRNSTTALVDISVTAPAGGQRKLMDNFSDIGERAGCTHLDLVPNYLDNLLRLGLLQIPVGRIIQDSTEYDALLHSQTFKNIKAGIEDEETQIIIKKKYVELSTFGIQFVNACVIDKAGFVN